MPLTADGESLIGTQNLNGAIASKVSSGNKSRLPKRNNLRGIMRNFVAEYFLMRYYIIAGEASGDLHGSNLIKALRKQDEQAEIRAWGGDKMEAAGAKLVKHYRDLAFMGFVEVIKHLRTIFKNIDFCKKDILAFKPDVLVLIDYPGFNLRIAAWAKQQGIKVVYYISPQVWAWKEGRVKQIKQNVDKMLVILPFEVPFYEEKWDYKVDYVGHPLVEVIQNEVDNVPVVKLSDKPIIALLPGSRTQEIKLKLPIMLSVVKDFPEYQFIVAGAPSQPDELYQELIGEMPVLLVRNQTYNILKQAKAALVTSGTATLETALFGVPQVVCYKGNPVSFWLAKKLVKVKYVSLVNLIMDREVVKELLQDDLSSKNVREALSLLVSNGAYISEMMNDYKALWNKLGDLPASQKAASIITELIDKKTGFS